MVHQAGITKIEPDLRRQGPKVLIQVLQVLIVSPAHLFGKFPSRGRGDPSDCQLPPLLRNFRVPRTDGVVVQSKMISQFRLVACMS
jgi:hypothetical protein